ncbi:DUF3164 family protein [uncultured Sphaerochaeta sp.]|uniref:DUF3164 family protein n=1 Tax=uncultured Sphaerochaeta sp. TaxID=886478 RepID=UPI002A0A5F69|nr:DUF3164 family protein [uncultured Sphaerochaeta sp.]
MKKELNGKTYYENSRGSLVPEELIKPYDLIKDQTVMLCFHQVMELRSQMEEVKLQVMQSVSELQDVLASEYKVKLGGKKENLCVTSYDGSIRIIVAVNEYQSFDEKIHIAKQVIDGCIERWSEGTNANLKAIIDQAFALNQSGHMNIRSIVGLRKLNIEDADWVKAMTIISDSLQTVTSKKYFRVYRRDPFGKYQMIDFDLASI